MIALADCNTFFASVERALHPGLKGKPVCVLSSNDGNIVALTAEAKALGLKRGDPFFKVRDIIERNGVAVFSGNLMLYGNNCVVLFYETFNSSYSYIRLGAIDDHSGLAAALGSGNVSVRFESSSTTTENLTPNVQSDDVQSTKVLRDGQFYINRNGATYNVQGVKVNAE